MKVRFVGGPFGGQAKNITLSDYGRDEIIMRGPKKMTRKQKWEWMQDNRGASWERIGHTTGGSPVSVSPYPAMPIVEARYRLSMRPHHNGYQVANLPCMHPDGSLFYEYVDKSKREV